MTALAIIGLIIIWTALAALLTWLIWRRWFLSSGKKSPAIKPKTAAPKSRDEMVKDTVTLIVAVRRRVNIKLSPASNARIVALKKKDAKVIAVYVKAWLHEGENDKLQR